MPNETWNFITDFQNIKVLSLFCIQVNHLVKELLIMGELNQQQKDVIQKLALAEGQNPESNLQLHGCHRELAGTGEYWYREFTVLCACLQLVLL